jgi:hypothetical protein
MLFVKVLKLSSMSCVALGLFLSPQHAISAEWQQLPDIVEREISLEQWLKIDQRANCVDLRVRLVNTTPAQIQVDVRYEKVAVTCKNGVDESLDSFYVRMGPQQTTDYLYSKVCCGKGGPTQILKAATLRRAFGDKLPTTPTNLRPCAYSVECLANCIREKFSCRDASTDNTERERCDDIYFQCADKRI